MLGDGEALSTAPTTRWYKPKFIVNNDPATNFYDEGGFSVDVGWNNDGTPEGSVSDDERNRIPDDRASVEIVWLDSSTLQVIATIEGPQVEVTRMRVEMSARLQDADGNETATFGNDACWQPA